MPDDLLSHDVPSDDVRILPDDPTETYFTLVVVVDELVLDELVLFVCSSLSSPQEITNRLKRNIRII